MGRIGFPNNFNAFTVARRLRLPGAGLDLSGQDLRGTDLSGQDLRLANLAGANLSGVRLRNVDLTSADLAGADLRGARLVRVRLADVCLTGSRWDRAALLGADLDDATASAPELAVVAIAGRDPAEPVLMPRGVDVGTLAHSPDGSLLAAAWGPSVVLHDTVDLRPLLVVPGTGRNVQSLAFGLDYNDLVVLDGCGGLTRWCLSPGRHAPAVVINGVTLVGRTPNGDLVFVVSSADGVSRLWRSDPDGTVQPGTALGRRLSRMCVSVDGGALAAVRNLRKGRTWGIDVTTVRFDGTDPLFWTTAHPVEEDAPRAIAVSLRAAAGRIEPTVATGHGGSDDPGSVRIGRWERLGSLDLSSYGKVREISGHVGGVESLQFSPDGSLVASLDNGRHVFKRFGRHRFKPGVILMSDVKTGRRLWSAEVSSRYETQPAQSTLSFSSDGTWLATGGAALRALDSSDGRILAELPGIRRSYTSVACTPSGFLAHGVGGSVRVWDLSSGKVGPAGLGLPVPSFTSSGDGLLLAYVRGGSVYISATDAAGGGRRLSTPSHLYAASMAFAPSGRILACATKLSAEKYVLLWDVESNVQFRSLAGYRGEVTSVAFSPDGRFVAGGENSHGHDARVLVWDAETGELVRTLGGHRGAASSVAFHPGGGLLASGERPRGQGGRVFLWDVATGEVVRESSDHDGGVSAVAFSPDGSVLASASAGRNSGEGRVRLWDPISGAEVGNLMGHPGGVGSIVFHPNGRLLASAGADGCVRLWDVAERVLVAALVTFGSGWAVVLPDGSYKLSGEPGGRLWWAVGLCRFEPGEIDEYDPRVRRLDNDAVIPSLAAYLDPP